jgi:hypothetical protein
MNPLIFIKQTGEKMKPLILLLEASNKLTKRTCFDLKKAIRKSTDLTLRAIILLLAGRAFAADITVDASSGKKPVSPAIYGKNNSLSDDSSRPKTKAEWQIFRDAGVRLFRDTGGNNSTKYNWRLKLSSHPDWYNNVYAHDWNFIAKSIQDNTPDAGGLFSFQLIGWAAANKDNNFNDWGYNGSQWWSGVNNNWAGGGGPDNGDGDPGAYLEEWTADSTAGILDRWFGARGLGFDKSRFRYWNMDNEPEIWQSTHDDVVTSPMPAEEFLGKYFAVAKKARALFPEIKLLGPVPANEWQWYAWNTGKIASGGKNYTWLEYFIKRIAEEQQTSGVRLLDVLDLHFYPYETKPADILQLHRIWFDRKYNYPGANGVKTSGPGGWDNGITREYIFGRCGDWLVKYLGPDHGVTFGVSEMGVKGDDPNVTASWYASTLGVFADEGVEVFTPWDWKIGMWEVLHLFSRYGKTARVSSVSSDSVAVSAYSTVNGVGDSLTVILVNRDLSQSRDATVSLSRFNAADGDYATLSLSRLPSTETFKSHADNALKHSTVSVKNDSFTMSLPSLSVTAVLLSGRSTDTTDGSGPSTMKLAFDIYPNPFNPGTTFSYSLSRSGRVKIDVFDTRGRFVRTVQDAAAAAGPHTVRFDGSNLAGGIYLVRIAAGSEVIHKKMMLVR